MKLSQAIAQLNQLIDEVGDIDLEIECHNDNGAAYSAIPTFEFDGQETVIVKEDWGDKPTDIVYVEEAGEYYALPTVIH